MEVLEDGFAVTFSSSTSKKPMPASRWWSSTASPSIAAPMAAISASMSSRRTRFVIPEPMNATRSSGMSR